jgi:hypothetical protein
MGCSKSWVRPTQALVWKLAGASDARQIVAGRPAAGLDMADAARLATQSALPNERRFELFRRDWHSMTSVAIFTLVALGLPGRAQASENILRPAGSAEIADNTIDESADTLAGKQMEVARFLIARLDYTAAINRLKIVVTTFQATRYVEEALADLAEAYLALGIPAEAETAVAVLDRKFPNGPWSAKAQAALTAAGFKPIEDEKSWISKAFK